MLWGGCHGNVTHLILYPSPKRTGSPRTLSPEAAFVSQLSGAEITSAAAACPADWEAAWDTREAREKKNLVWFVSWIIRLGDNVCSEFLCETTAKWNQMLPFFFFWFDWIFTSCKVRRLKTYQGFSLKKKFKTRCPRVEKWCCGHDTLIVARNTKQLTKFWEWSRNSKMSWINELGEVNKYPEKARCAYFNPLQTFNPVKSNSCVQRKLSSHGNSGCRKLLLQNTIYCWKHI